MAAVRMRHVITTAWFYYVLIVALLIAGISCNSSECTTCSDDDAEDMDWICNSGQKIPADKICDGIAECKDGSDETALNCLNITCPSYAFRCTYGACIQGSLRCNGHADCVDGSDELDDLCKNHDYQQIQLTWQGDCKSDEQFQCDNHECIDQELLCDGTPECVDGSDETEKHCKSIHCPGYGFHCAYGGCVSGAYKCDRIVHCADGSDELDSVCGEDWFKTAKWIFKRPPTPQPCTSQPPVTQPVVPHLPVPQQPVLKPAEPQPPVPHIPDTETHSASGGCVVPQMLQHLLGVEKNTKKIVRRGELLPNGTVLRFYCTRGWQLDGTRRSRCRDGTWTKPLPECNRYCSGLALTRGISTKATCTFGGKLFDCANNDLPVGVQAHIRCALGYHHNFTNNDSNVHELSISCDPDAEWNMPHYKCKPICGRLSENIISKRNPWEVSIFRRSMQPIFEFLCYGVIISPKIVLTAANCLRLTQLDSGNDKMLTEPIYYNVLEGLSSDPYTQEPNKFSRDIHNISEIIVSNRSQSLNEQIALFVLIHYFTFKPTLSPICFDTNESIPTEVMLEFDRERLAQEIAMEIGSIISQSKDEGGIRTHYIGAVASKISDDGRIQLLRVHYYKQLINKLIKRYRYIL